MRYSGDRQRSQQGRLLRGTHLAADHTHNGYNRTGSDDFIDKEWEWEDVQDAADTRIVPGDNFRDSVQNAPSVSAHQGPAEGQRGGGGNRRGTVDSGQWVVGSVHRRCAGTRCSVHCGAGGCRPVRPCLVGGPGRPTTRLLQQLPVVRIPPASKAGPRGRGAAEWCGGYLGSGACSGGEGRRWGSGPKMGTAGGSGSGGGGMEGEKES